MPESNNTTNPDSLSVLNSWQDNADAWTDAIRQQKIQSRTLVTNDAIVDAVLSQNPKTVLDLGCGEGWLSWHLASENIKVLGVDAIDTLIAAAQRLETHSPDATPEFHQISYSDIGSSLLGQRFDLAVCNFSLLDKDNTASLLSAVPALLAENGALIIQTLHPDHLSTSPPENDGWRVESWSGMGDSFKGNAPWYYRTLSSWQQLFKDSGLTLTKTLEPVHPHTGQPASIIFFLSA